MELNPIRPQCNTRKIWSRKTSTFTFEESDIGRYLPPIDYISVKKKIFRNNKNNIFQQHSSQLVKPSHCIGTPYIIFIKGVFFFLNNSLGDHEVVAPKSQNEKPENSVQKQYIYSLASPHRGFSTKQNEEAPTKYKEILSK